MAKTEKVAFILEQVRLCLSRLGLIRCPLSSPPQSTKTGDRVTNGRCNHSIGIALCSYEILHHTPVREEG